ncbi:MAG TPA: hypothetical protein VD862_02820 [Candidatus Paceibacterota bacterium]|nr:hypothetical protein [Candidatus Paceibacterota bacterium]
MSEASLGDVITAMPLEQPRERKGHTYLVRGVYLWDYGNGTILVHTRERSHVCRKPGHPVIHGLSSLPKDEQTFVLATREQLVRRAKEILANPLP